MSPDLPSCADCRALHRFNPGRPDCDSENPQYDGTCPRRLQKINSPVIPGIAKFMFLAGWFIKHNVLPIKGGLLDQDLRFVWTVMAMDAEIAKETETAMKKAMKKVPKF